MLGKIIVMKSLAISKITYSVTSRSTAEIDNFTQKLNKILYSYLLDKKERIKRKNTLIGKIEWGGIEILDIRSHFIAIKTVWVKLILSSSAPWSIIGSITSTYMLNVNRIQQ